MCGPFRLNHLSPSFVQDRARLRGRAGVALLLALVLAAIPASAARSVQPQQWRWTTEERVVVIGDVHGAYDSLVELLSELDLLSVDGRWSGGQAHLVVLGDLIDRGPRSRDVLDLVMRLQGEARAAGGWVHVVLGNHEVMNLVGDLRYLDDSDWAAFAHEEKPRERDRYIKKRLRLAAALNGEVEAQRATLAGTFPPGFFARARAFAPDGMYGKWLLDQHILVVVNGVVFVHGGLPESLLELEPDRVNQVAVDELRGFIEAQERLRELGVLGWELSPGQQLYRLRDLVHQNVWRSTKAAARAQVMLDAIQGLTMGDDGPLWYRGTSLNPIGGEARTVTAVLDHLGATGVVVGHTPTHTGRIMTRLDGAVVRADTGMLTSHYGGRAAAVVLDDGQLHSFYPDEGLAPLTAQRWELALGSFSGAGEVEAFLATASIISAEEVGTGSTHPLLVTLTDDGRRGQAIFKSVETAAPCQTGGAAPDCRDSYAHEVAAYRVDRALGLDMVPPTVIREIDGQVGSLQLWVEGAVNENIRRDEDLQPSDPADLAEQLRRVQLLDRLILNLNRNGTGLLITTRDWKVHLIDHSRAFGPAVEVPATPIAPDEIGKDLAERLRSLRPESLRFELDDLLTEAELEALLARLEALRGEG